SAGGAPVPEPGTWAAAALLAAGAAFMRWRQRAKVS
ncbi:MAG: PEP-CTERM sorting domain-containing protein, partial [Chthoniobacterales bacterium]